MEISEKLKALYLKFLDGSQSILFFISILLILYMFVIQPHEVSGLSMYPTFNDKEYLLSYLLDAKFNNIKRGDVVVFHSPVEEDKLYIKRVIGIPGDKISINKGSVFLNGEKLDESKYLEKTVGTYGGASLPDGQEMIVTKNTYFVMGDNRPYSSDSRHWGLLDISKLIGRSIVRVFPPHKFKVIERY